MMSLLETAVGLAVIFLSIAAICSAITEVLSSFLNMRARMLWSALEDLVGAETAKNMKASHLVQARSRNSVWEKLLIRLGIRPSESAYISKGLFFLSMVDVAARAHGEVRVKTAVNRSTASGEPVTASSSAEGGEGPPPSSAVGAGVALQDDIRFPSTTGELITLLSHLPNESVRRALKILVSQAGEDLSSAQSNIGEWFEESMSEVSAWYRRWSQAAIFFVALVVAGVLGADTVSITDQLWTNAELRHETLQAAASLLDDETVKTLVTGRSAAPAEAADVAKPAEGELPGAASTPSTAGTSTSSTSGAPGSAGVAPRQGTPEDLKAAAQLLDGLQKLGLDFHAYNTERLTKQYRAKYGTTAQPGLWALVFLWLTNHGVGFVLTALSASMGAPFWFGVLNRIVPVRLSASAADESSRSSGGGGSVK